MRPHGVVPCSTAYHHIQSTVTSPSVTRLFPKRSSSLALALPSQMDVVVVVVVDDDTAGDAWNTGAVS